MSPTFAVMPVVVAEMTASELAAIIVAVASVLGVVVLAFALVALTRTLAMLRLSIEELRRETLPVIDELQRTVSQANADLERLDGLLDSATSVTNTVDSASQKMRLNIPTSPCGGRRARRGRCRWRTRWP